MSMPACEAFIFDPGYPPGLSITECDLRNFTIPVRAMLAIFAAHGPQSPREQVKAFDAKLHASLEARGFAVDDTVRRLYFRKNCRPCLGVFAPFL